MQRLEPVISEMEREGESIVIVSHQVRAHTCNGNEEGSKCCAKELRVIE